MCAGGWPRDADGNPGAVGCAPVAPRAVADTRAAAAAGCPPCAPPHPASAARQAPMARVDPLRHTGLHAASRGLRAPEAGASCGRNLIGDTGLDGERERRAGEAGDGRVGGAATRPDYPRLALSPRP